MYNKLKSFKSHLKILAIISLINLESSGESFNLFRKSFGHTFKMMKYTIATYLYILRHVKSKIQAKKKNWNIK